MVLCCNDTGQLGQLFHGNATEQTGGSIIEGTMNGEARGQGAAAKVQGGSRYVEGCQGFPYLKKFIGFVNPWFLVSWLLGFWFLGLLVSWFSWFLGFRASWFLDFKDSENPSMF